MKELTVNKVKEALHESLRLRFEGFKKRNSPFQYVKKTKGISHIWSIELHGLKSSILVKPLVFVGSSEANKIFNIISDFKIPVSGETHGFAINNEYPDRGQYWIRTHEDIGGVADCLLLDFEEIAVPLFDRVSEVSDIDSLMNNVCTEGFYRPESTSRACLGLIVAHLSGNPNFKRICDDYYRFSIEAWGADLSEPILKTRDYFVGAIAAKSEIK